METSVYISPATNIKHAGMLVGNFGTNLGLVFRNLLKINMKNTLFCLDFPILFTSSERIELNCKLQNTFLKKKKY